MDLSFQEDNNGIKSEQENSTKNDEINRQSIQSSTSNDNESVTKELVVAEVNNNAGKTQEQEKKDKQPAIEYKTHFSYGYDDDDDIKTDDLNYLEPKLREAWIEMRRLDKVLKRVSEKEKRVKLETKSMIEKYRVELELLKMTSDRKESKQEQENTANYIALSYNDTNANKNADDEVSNDDGMTFF